MTKSEMAIIRQAASIWGRLGGSSTSPAKQAASRRNGLMGGRPPKVNCLRCVHRFDDCMHRSQLLSRRLKDKPFSCSGFERLGGVQGAKSPRLKPHDPPKPSEARPSKKKKPLTRKRR